MNTNNDKPQNHEDNKDLESGNKQFGGAAMPGSGSSSPSKPVFGRGNWLVDKLNENDMADAAAAAKAAAATTEAAAIAAAAATAATEAAAEAEATFQPSQGRKGKAPEQAKRVKSDGAESG